MTHEEFEAYRASVKSKRIALEKLLVTIDPTLLPVIEGFKYAVDKAAEKYKLNK